MLLTTNHEEVNGKGGRRQKGSHAVGYGGSSMTLGLENFLSLAVRAAAVKNLDGNAVSVWGR